MFVLVLATLAGGILTCVAAWPWLGLGAVFLAPFGAGTAAAFAGLFLASLRSRRPAGLQKRVADPSPAEAETVAPLTIANDTVAGRRRRA